MYSLTCNNSLTKLLAFRCYGYSQRRGRRFAADRNPLQYKPVPVTEYILVYRKRTNKLIDWNIRAHPKQELVQASRVDDGYERTNIWRIKPAHDKQHPAIFPVELAEKVISYYSFKEDVVLDPFAGIGTVGEAAIKLGRRFVLIEQNPQYVAIMRSKVKDWLGVNARSVFTINCAPMESFISSIPVENPAEVRQMFLLAEDEGISAEEPVEPDDEDI
jgi:DNA modification methylase